MADEKTRFGQTCTTFSRNLDDVGLSMRTLSCR